MFVRTSLCGQERTDRAGARQDKTRQDKENTGKTIVCADSGQEAISSLALRIRVRVRLGLGVRVRVWFRVRFRFRIRLRVRVDGGRK